MHNVTQEDSRLLVSVGAAIGSCRHSLSMTEADLASALGVSIGLLSQIEAGKADINLNVLESCACLFGITMVELLELAETLKEGGEVVCLDFSEPGPTSSS